jgi:hypothetical protein
MQETFGCTFTIGDTENLLCKFKRWKNNGDAKWRDVALWGQPIFRFPSETVADVVIGDAVTELDGSFVLNAFLFGEGMSTMEEIMDEIPNGGKLPTTKK